MANIDEDLSQLERFIRQLKIEYEQYFGGGRTRPPTETEWRAEQIVKRYDGRMAEINSGQRFRYGNLTQTFAKYKEIWRKKLREREEGTVHRHFGAAARAIEAERAKARAAKSGDDRKTRGKKVAAETVFQIAVAEPEREREKVETLYRAMVEAHEMAGETKSVPSLADFRQFVARKTDELRKKKQDGEVEYAVAVEPGKVKLTARLKG